MATSTGKTIALIIIVVLIICFFGLSFSPLGFAPFGIFTGISRVIRLPNLNEISIGSHGLRWTALSLMSVVLFILWIVVIVWVYRDAERRRMNGVLWALLVFIGNIIGLLIYLIVRSDAAHVPPSREPTQTCPNCEKSISGNYTYCPHCGKPLEELCSQCKKPVESTWKACPHCGEKLETK